MDENVARAKRDRLIREARRREIEAQREAVKAWADSPDFPEGSAGPLVFYAAGRAATVADDAIRLLEELSLHAFVRSQYGDGDSKPEAILSAASIALQYYGSSEQMPDACKAFEIYHTAAFDYFATAGRGGNATMFRRKSDFRTFLLASIREATISPWDAVTKLHLVSRAVAAGSSLFPSLIVLDGIRDPFQIIHERLAKSFDASCLAKPIPPPTEGTADGGEAAEIAFDLLVAAGVPNKVVRNFISVAGDMKTLRKLKKAADSAGVATTPKRPRGRRPRP